MWKDDATAADILMAARAIREFVAGQAGSASLALNTPFLSQ